MKKTLLILLIISVPIFFVQANEAVEVSAELLEFNIDSIIGYIMDSFTAEFKTVFTKTPTLFLLLILFGIKSCMDMKESINKTVALGLFSATALISIGIFNELFAVFKETISALSNYIYISIPMLCGLLAGGGMVVTSLKATFIILSSMNVITFLLNHFFIPITQIYLVLSVISSLLENDALKTLKDNIKAIIKVSLPSIIGIFMALLTIFVNVTKKMDDFSLKSARLAVGSMVPFLGGALADSTEVVLNSIGQLRAQTGIAGLLAMIYIFLLPMLKVISGILAFKLLSITAGFLSDKKMAEYYEDLSAALSILGGLLATISVIAIISVVILIGV